MPPAMFPKIAVVCGAHTELGKLVLRDLLRSPDIDIVHALAEVDPRDGISAHPANMRKLRLYIESLDYVNLTLKRYVSDADIAFVTLGSSRDDLSSRGAYEFHKNNFGVPLRFVEHMFTLGVQRIAVLSATGAESRVRGNEFLHVKGELVDAIVRMQREAGRYAPAVALFRVPFLLTNKADLHGKGDAVPIVNKIKQHAVLKFDVGAAQAVHIRDVAKAMVADTLANADKEEESDLAFRFKKRQYDLTELTGRDIVSLANETRALQKSSFQRQKDKEAVAQRISQFAKQEGAMRDENDDDDDEQGSRGSDELGSYGSGSLVGSHEELEMHQGEGSQHEGSEHEGSPYHGSPRPSDEDGVPRVENARQQFVQGGSIPSSRPSSAARNAQAVPLGSVESLGQQIGRKLTKIKGNELLPDIEPDGPRRRSRPRLSGPHIAGDMRDVQVSMLGRPHQRGDMQGYGDDLAGDDGSEIDVATPRAGLHGHPQQSRDTQGCEDDLSGDDGLEIGDTSSWVGLHGHPQQDRDTQGFEDVRPSSANSIGAPEPGPPRSPESAVEEGEEEEDIAFMPGDTYTPSSGFRRRESYAARASRYVSGDSLPKRELSQDSYVRRQGNLSRRTRKHATRTADAGQTAPPIERFSALVGRIITVTDRPSARGRTRHRRVVIEEFKEEEAEYDYEPPIRGNGDMREAENVAI